MTQPPAAHSSPHEPPQQHPPHEQQPQQTVERRVLVKVTIALASLLFVATAGLLYLRWATMREPTCVFIVEAPTALRGAEVTMDGVSVLQPHTVVIGRGERFAIPFYLDYGTYRLRVTLNGATVVETDIELTHERPWQKIDLTQVPPPPPPPSTASAPTTASSPLFTPQETQGLPTLTPPFDGSRLSP